MARSKKSKPSKGTKSKKGATTNDILREVKKLQATVAELKAQLTPRKGGVLTGQVTLKKPAAPTETTDEVKLKKGEAGWDLVRPKVDVNC